MKLNKPRLVKQVVDLNFSEYFDVELSKQQKNSYFHLRTMLNNSCSR